MACSFIYFFPFSIEERLNRVFDQIEAPPLSDGADQCLVSTVRVKEINGDAYRMAKNSTSGLIMNLKKTVSYKRLMFFVSIFPAFYVIYIYRKNTND